MGLNSDPTNLLSVGPLSAHLARSAGPAKVSSPNPQRPFAAGNGTGATPNLHRPRVTGARIGSIGRTGHVPDFGRPGGNCAAARAANAGRWSARHPTQRLRKSFLARSGMIGNPCTLQRVHKPV